jgi:signal peptidase II
MVTSSRLSLSDPSRWWVWLCLAAVIVLLDQLSKTLIASSLQLGDSHTVTQYFNIVRAHNSGAAFSFLASAGGWQRWFFTGLGLIASLFMVWMLKSHSAQRLFSTAITLILGGAVGNVIDRLLHGHVIDFIQLHYAGRAFPAFNLADSAITLGAAFLIYDELRRVRKAR